MEAILPRLVDLGVQVQSCELTETRLYLKGILPSLSDTLPDGAVWGNGHTAIADYRGNEAGKVVAALCLSNSEVGAGSVRLEPSVFTTWCTNLAVLAQAAMKKYHVGRSADVGDDWTVYRDETRKADDAAFFMRVQDVTAAAFDEKIFQAAIASIRAAADDKIESSDLQAVVEQAVEVLALPERASTGILASLARGGDLSRWGLSSAVTATANGTGDYEAATDLERAGGKLLAMTGAAWHRISRSVNAES